MIRRTFLASVALLAGSLSCHSAEPAKQAAAKVDPQADKVLHTVADFYRKADSVSVQMVSVMLIMPINDASETVTMIKFGRPNRLAARLESGANGATIISDGKQSTVFFPALNRYTVSDAPKTADGLLTGPMEALTMAQGMMFVIPFFSPNPYDVLLEEVSEVRYVGEEEIDKTKTHRIKFVKTSMDWDLWVNAGDKPTIVCVKPDLTRLLAAGAARLPENFTLELRIDFKDWNLAAKLTDDDFKFTAPEGAQKVDSLFGADQGGPHPLTDKPAPEFDMKLLDGGSVNLATHKGKEIVILDFWATWCGPCVQALPTIAGVAADYKKKGVAFYAVNLEEEPDAVRAFLKEQNLTIPVALDSDGKVAAAYAASAIPQTVIIDKQGTVAVVHVGASPELKAELASELDALLAGKKPDAK